MPPLFRQPSPFLGKQEFLGKAVPLGEITATPQGEFRLSHRLLRLAQGYRCRLFLAKQEERVWEGLIYEQSPE